MAYFRKKKVKWTKKKNVEKATEGTDQETDASNRERHTRDGIQTTFSMHRWELLSNENGDTERNCQVHTDDDQLFSLIHTLNSMRFDSILSRRMRIPSDGIRTNDSQQCKMDFLSFLRETNRNEKDSIDERRGMKTTKKEAQKRRTTECDHWLTLNWLRIMWNAACRRRHFEHFSIQFPFLSISRSSLFLLFYFISHFSSHIVHRYQSAIVNAAFVVHHKSKHDNKLNVIHWQCNKTLHCELSICCWLQRPIEQIFLSSGFPFFFSIFGWPKHLLAVSLRLSLQAKHSHDLFPSACNWMHLCGSTSVCGRECRSCVHCFAFSFRLLLFVVGIRESNFRVQIIIVCASKLNWNVLCSFELNWYLVLSFKAQSDEVVNAKARNEKWQKGKWVDALINHILTLTHRQKGIEWERERRAGVCWRRKAAAQFPKKKERNRKDMIKVGRFDFISLSPSPLLDAFDPFVCPR